MYETHRMLGQERQADLDREAERLHRGAPLRRQRRRVARAMLTALAVAVVLLLVWLFAVPG
jgi:ferric-dicitrate binding protein FerR (iron transport regulator)